MKHPVIEMHMKSGNSIKMELFPEHAPNAVNSILELADLGGYKNMAIQRIAPDFVLQPWYDERRMDDRFHYVMDREISLPFTAYTVGMAGDGRSMSSCGCFFITVKDETALRLNGKFTAAGRVTEGFDELERIMHVETRQVESGMEGVVVMEPEEPEIILDVTYECNGYMPQPPKKKKEYFD